MSDLNQILARLKAIVEENEFQAIAVFNRVLKLHGFPIIKYEEYGDSGTYWGELIRILEWDELPSSDYKDITLVEA